MCRSTCVFTNGTIKTLNCMCRRCIILELFVRVCWVRRAGVVEKCSVLFMLLHPVGDFFSFPPIFIASPIVPVNPDIATLFHPTVYTPPFPPIPSWISLYPAYILFLSFTIESYNHFWTVPFLAFHVNVFSQPDHSLRVSRVAFFSGEFGADVA